MLDAGDLFDPRAVIKYVSMWILGPSMSMVLAYGSSSPFRGSSRGTYVTGCRTRRMLSSILVPMDDSDPAGHALEYALDNHPEAEVTVLHVVGVPSMMMGEAVGLTLEDDVEEAAAERAVPVFERAREVADERGREIETVVGIGHPSRNVVDRADEFDAVVVGAHGADRGRLTRRFLVGNVAETVSKRAPVPVTIVR